MVWVLVICGQALGLCGYIREVKFESRVDCMLERNELYRTQGAAAFKYIICEPRAAAKPLT